MRNFIIIFLEDYYKIIKQGLANKEIMTTKDEILNETGDSST